MGWAVCGHQRMSHQSRLQNEDKSQSWSDSCSISLSYFETTGAIAQGGSNCSQVKSRKLVLAIRNNHCQATVSCRRQWACMAWLVYARLRLCIKFEMLVLVRSTEEVDQLLVSYEEIEYFHACLPNQILKLQRERLHHLVFTKICMSSSLSSTCS